VRAIPQARRCINAYPTPAELADASVDEIRPYFETLGLFRRAGWLIAMANQWLRQPPTAGVLHRKPAYVQGGDDLVSEVAHLTGVGRYASDAWRIFCKDQLYREAGWVVEVEEWRVVEPLDKELVAYLERRWEMEGGGVEEEEEDDYGEEEQEQQWQEEQEQQWEEEQEQQWQEEEEDEDVRDILTAGLRRLNLS
jgi:methyl-CpG-binding domain protein 4